MLHCDVCLKIKTRFLCLCVCNMAEEEDFQAVMPDHVPVRMFFDDPIDNLQLRVLVKRVPPQMRKLKNESLKRAAMTEKLIEQQEKQERARRKKEGGGSADAGNHARLSVPHA
jgi:hypothetical protein